MEEVEEEKNANVDAMNKSKDHPNRSQVMKNRFEEDQKEGGEYAPSPSGSAGWFGYQSSMCNIQGEDSDSEEGGDAAQFSFHSNTGLMPPATQQDSIKEASFKRLVAAETNALRVRRELESRQARAATRAYNGPIPISSDEYESEVQERPDDLKSRSSSFFNFDDYLVVYVKQNIPKPRRIKRKVLVTTQNSLSSVQNLSAMSKRSQKQISVEQVKPKSKLIGTQLETTDENVLESSASLFEDEEDSRILGSEYTNPQLQNSEDKRFMTASPVKKYNHSSAQGFQGRQQDISN